MIHLVKAIAGGQCRRIFRCTALAAAAMTLTACEPVPQADSDRVVLPNSTPRISARQERNRQLASGAYQDDIPEYTGAPGIDARWPSYVPITRKTVYRDQDVILRK